MIVRDAERCGPSGLARSAARAALGLVLGLGLAATAAAQTTPSSYFGDGILYQSNASGFGQPSLPQRGEWAEVIMANTKWMVLQNAQGQQFPVSMENVNTFLIRWPTNAAALTPSSTIEVTGTDIGSNRLVTDHIDVFEGAARRLVTPTAEVNQGFSLLLSPLGLGRSSLSGAPNPGMAGIWGAPNTATFVGNVVGINPVQVDTGGNVVYAVLPSDDGMSMTQVTVGVWSYIRAGDLVFYAPASMTTRSLILSNMVLYKNIPFAQFATN